MEPLLLLPGMMCDARVFGPQIKHFGRDRTIHLPPLTRHDTVEMLAKEILTHAPERFALAGLSMGAVVALEVIRRAPERVSRLMLVGTSGLPDTPQISAERDLQIARVMAGRLPDVVREELKPNYLAPGPNQAPTLDLVMEMALDLGEGAFVRQSRALQRRPDQQSVFRRITVPTFVICGQHDALCPVARHEFIAGMIPNAELHVVRDAGHLPTLETPDAVIERMEDWLVA